ncbi:hypothetical protein BS50DRAFT_607105 [Corynespora cassiicola Philippines]|uniref:Ig-like domain-containing protein n=1 Tax=Corynespora cassiicola Philippines TaxID=1448308 RepID=A0A2T2P747_CORCC|nr:hypothetical protein BS50DRAFT_607105 [Corynespora cassiicola Philippines]
MKSIGWLLLVSHASAQNAPDLETYRLAARRNENEWMITGEPTRDRTIFTVISLVSMFLLSLLLGTRLSSLKHSLLMKRNIMTYHVSGLYLVVLVYIVVACVMVSGQGMWNYSLCVAGTWICLMFYTIAKAIIYTYLVERVHVVRAPYLRRRDDRIYLACMGMVIVLYSAVSLNSYLHPVTQMEDYDGRCHFGIDGRTAIPIIAVNLFTDLVLTGVFFYLLRPVVRQRGMATVSGFLERSKVVGPERQEPDDGTAVQKNIRTLLKKSIIGSILIEIPTAANMIQFYVTEGKELGMICLAICMFDVVWDTLIIHWLTFGSSGEAEKNLTRSTQSSRRTVPIQVPAPAASAIRREITADTITNAPPRQYDCV